MANPNRFKKFIYEIASGEVEWQYEDGTEMNSDVASFVNYLEALENQKSHNQQINVDQAPQCENCGGPLDSNSHCKHCNYPDDIKP